MMQFGVRDVEPRRSNSFGEREPENLTMAWVHGAVCAVGRARRVNGIEQ